MKNIIESNVIHCLKSGETNSGCFKMRITKMRYNYKVFDRITKLIRDKVLDVAYEGIYMSSFELFMKCRFLRLEVFVYETDIEVITTIITY